MLRVFCVFDELLLGGMLGSSPTPAPLIFFNLDCKTACFRESSSSVNAKMAGMERLFAKMARADRLSAKTAGCAIGLPAEAQSEPPNATHGTGEL